MDQHWVVIDDIALTKNVYIFRSNNELLISQNGKVEKAKWEYLGNNSLLIDRKEESFLFKHGFFDENILALKIDSKEEYAFLVNETRYDKELNSLEAVGDFLQSKYLDPQELSEINDNIKIKPEFTYLLHAQNDTPNSAYKYRIAKRIERTSLLSDAKTEISEIEFEDGQYCPVYLNLKTNETFFWAEVGIWGPQKVMYYDFDKCVNAAYHYLKTGKILNKGLKEF